ncbi:serine hydrolase [Elongatibacter sediminis]|uniref:Serine hydrolase n=1 Tax=Elongatibacter sediminis TaxID=3119006 RepID=A0AAW9RKF3_9GAMM
MRKEFAFAALLCVVLTGATSSATAASKFTDLSGNPGLRSESALVLDPDGQVVYAKNPGTVRPIASITKLMTAMVILDSDLDPDENITITRADRDTLQLTGSRLGYGATLTRRELIMLALMSSENRAAAALGRSWPEGRDAFVEAMNRKAAALDMTDSRFADPAGLSPDNLSTARDLARMITAADGYPLIREATTTRRIEVRPWRNRGPLTYVNTNRLLKNANWQIELSKTGYLNESGRCLVMRANIGGEDLSIVLLNSFGKLTPFGDSNRLRKWLLAQR